MCDKNNCKCKDHGVYKEFGFGVDESEPFNAQIVKSEDLDSENEQEVETLNVHEVLDICFFKKAMLISLVVGCCLLLLFGFFAGVVSFALTLCSYYMFARKSD